MHARFTAGVRTGASPALASESLNSPKGTQAGSRFKAGSSWGGLSRRNSGGHGVRRLPSVLAILGITLACVFLTTQMLRSALLTRHAGVASQRADAHDQMTRRTLSFDACSGMANQRLSILYGVLFAVELGRTVVLPKVTIPDSPLGAQAPSAAAAPAASSPPPAAAAAAAASATKGRLVPFSQLYDAPHFIDELAAVGVDVLPEEELNRIAQTEVNLANLEDSLLDLHTKYGSISNLHISCPLFRLRRTSFRDSTLNVVWRTLAAIRPRREYGRLVEQLAGRLRAAGKARGFNVLHLRMETDWLQHCQKVKAAQDGKAAAADAGDNCMAHTDDVDKVSSTLSAAAPLFFLGARRIPGGRWQGSRRGPCWVGLGQPGCAQNGGKGRQQQLRSVKRAPCVACVPPAGAPGVQRAHQRAALRLHAVGPHRASKGGDGAGPTHRRRLPGVLLLLPLPCASPRCTPPPPPLPCTLNPPARLLATPLARVTLVHGR